MAEKNPNVLTMSKSADSSDSDAPRKVSFATQARISTGAKNDNQVVPTKTENKKRGTADTYSEASSATSGGSGDIYEVIEYDPDAQVSASMLAAGLDGSHDESVEYMGNELDIGEDTPAAEALRASAAVKVSRVGKAARAVNMQAVRKLVKRATLTSKSGVVKGKPPRLPPSTLDDFSENEEGDEEDDDDYDEDYDEDDDDDDQINEAHVHQPSQPSPPNIHKDHMPDDVVAGTAEAGKKVLVSVDPHDVIKVMRWRKKKKGEDKTPKSYVKGKVIDGEHELYTLSIAVMIGVRTSISKTNIVLNSGPSKRWVLPQDYRTMEKYEFRPKGGTGMPAHQLAHTFKFKDYAPVVFAYLRRLSGINEFDFLISVCGNANFIEFISNAKSGQFFFYSSDGRYMIKTMTNAESKFLRRMLPDYFRHCCENPNTMITRFFGMYRVKLYHLRRNVKFVIMNSVYYTGKYLQTFYDLKGSVVGRDAKPHHSVKKDNDLRRVLPQEALALPPKTKREVRSQLERDAKFMEEMGIMDYSMLVGIHHVPPKAADNSIATTGFHSSSRKNKRRSLPDLDHATLSQTKKDRSMSTMLSTPNSKRSGHSSSENEATPHQSVSRRQLAEEVGELAFEDGLDDDDSSYLEGSEKRSNKIARVNEDMKQKKLATIEKLYWPFHHLFDIHGHRRLNPVQCVSCGEINCVCIPDESLKGYSINKFRSPLSDRKDGGLEMDTTGLSLPMIYKGPNGEQLYEGKIFYMGIIDVLQEYNSRKMVEAQYRLFQASGKSDASCVDPRTYGLRFLKFFDEFTSRGDPDENEGVEMTLSLHQSKSSMDMMVDPSTPENKESQTGRQFDKGDETAAVSTNPRHESSATATPQRGSKGKSTISKEVEDPTKKDGENKTTKKSPRRRLFGHFRHHDD